MNRFLACAVLATLPAQSVMAVDIHDLFDSLDSNTWAVTDGFSNGSYTATYWRADHANIVDGKLILTQDDLPCSTTPSECAGKALAGAEVKTVEHFNYGEVEVSMKAARGEGFITGFFKYTGAFEGNPHDEVDFEVLGKDTTKLQLNYFVRGQGGHEKIIDLGFDAADDFHTYRYVHTPDYIEWYVDGTLVHSVRDTPLPSAAGKIYMNLWAAQPGTSTATYFAGNYSTDSLPATAEFDYINIIAYPDVPPTPPPSLEEQPPKAKYEGFDILDETWRLADGWSNGSFSATGWRKDHVTTNDGVLALKIDEQPCRTDPDSCSGKLTASGEVTSADFYGFGTVEASLQAAKGEGLVTSLFKFTGPWDGNPQDEIDMEILGKDTTKIQFNYFVNGEGGHEVTVDLGFDASEGFHTYGFRHTPNSIEWLVDGTIRHSVVDTPVPTYPGKIMMNLWAAQPGTSTATYFAGTYDPTQLPAPARYEYVHVTQGVPSLGARYSIQPEGSALVVGKASPQGATGSPVTLQVDAALDAQRWYMEQEEDVYRVKTFDGGNCLALQEDNLNRVETQVCVDSTSQKWALLDTGNGFNLISMLNGRCLEVQGGAASEGAVLKDKDCTGTDDQLFLIEGFTGGNASAPTVSPEIYALSNEASGDFLDIEDGNSRSANAEANEWYSGLSQTWLLENVEDNRYRLRPEHSHACLSLAYAGLASDINVVQYACSDSKSMQWTRNTKGKRTEWRNAFNDLCLTENATTGNITANTCDDSPAQRWQHAHPSQIPDSVVPLINVANNDALSISAANTTEGAAAASEVISGELHQQWQLERISDDYYHLRAQHSQHCLSLAYKALTPGIKTVQYNCTDSDAMLWQRLETGDTLKWINAFNGLCLSLSPAGTDNQITAETCTETEAQEWTTSPTTQSAGPETGTMVNAATGLNLAVAAASNTSGASAEQALASGENNQTWRAEPIGGGQFRLLAIHSEKCLSLAYKGSTSGVNTVQYACTNSEAMRWTKSSNGSLQEWRNVFNGHCLGVSPEDVVPGTQVKALSCDGSLSQQWQMN